MFRQRGQRAPRRRRQAADGGQELPAVRSAGRHDLEFDAEARYQDLSIDFDAIGEHLYQLDRAAKREGIGVALVIFDKRFHPRLFASRRGTWLKEHVRFMPGEPWIRHDEHYHVDFAVACRPLPG